MNIAKFSVKNPVLVNLVMVSVIVMGAIALIDLPQELVSNVEFHWVIIITPYSGASPEEMEKLITIPIEDAVSDVDRVKSINSTSAEGQSQVLVIFENISNDEYDKLFQDLKNVVDAIEDFPEEAEDPIWFELEMQEMMPIINVNISGDLQDRELLKIAKDLQKDILNIKHVSKAGIAGLREREIWVEVDPDRLYSYYLNLNQVINAIAMKNLNLPGGTIEVGRSEYLLRTIGEIDKVEQLENVIIRKTIGSGQVKIKDIATVIDTLEKNPVYSRLDGLPSISLSISKKPEGNIIDVIKEVRELVESRSEHLPENVSVTFTNDLSVPVDDILSVLKSNAYLGLALVLLILWLFLGWRNAAFAALGIPVTFMTAFIFLSYTGNSLNGNSLFGLVLVLGIVVDDAIIVVENCFRYIQKGLSPYKAAVIGSKEVMVPVLSATATTVAAFLPLMLVPGVMGEFMKVIPITVCLVLTASLIEVFFILPAHVAEWSPRVHRPNKRRFAFFTRLRVGYVRILKKFIRIRWLVLVLVFILLIISGVLMFLHLGVDLFAGDEIPQFFIWVTMPEGTSLDETDRVIKQLEKMTIDTLPENDVTAVLAYSGLLQSETDWILKPSVGQIFVELVALKDRDNRLDYYIDMMREQAATVSGPKSVEFSKIMTGPPVGPPIEVKVRGADYDKLQVIAGEIENMLEKIDGVSDVQDNFNYGKKELKIVVDEERAALYGLDIYQIASTIRTAFDGTVASRYRIEDEEVEVIVRFREEARRDIRDFDRMKIVTLTGLVVPLKDIVEYTIEPGYAAIYRTDRERAITVTADVDQRRANANAINRKIQTDFADLPGRFPGYSLNFGGEFDVFSESVDALFRLFLLGLFLIYIILGGQFKSFIQPLIIITAIPFAFIGAIFGLLLVNSPFSFTTMYGIVALAGIVVNDALVLITFINNARQQGFDRWRSIMTAGSVRLRPIILTSVTTIFGLLPMAVGLGGTSETWMPLATTIVGGLFFSTVFTLFCIPCAVAVVDDVRLFFGAKTLKPIPHLEEIEAL